MIISDNLYDQKIKVTDIEERIILSRPFQRLKHIHQKGFSYKISPIKHSRYEHSLGVFTLSYFFNLDQSYRLAALLHDVGHAPFSHSLKTIFKDNHRQRSKYYLDILEKN